MSKVMSYIFLDKERAMELYNDGLCDRDIAEKCGVKSAAVGVWRRKAGLPPNKPPKPVYEMSPIARDNAEARRLGMNYGAYKGLQYEAQRNRKAERGLEKLQRRLGKV